MEGTKVVEGVWFEFESLGRRMGDSALPLVGMVNRGPGVPFAGREGGAREGVSGIEAGELPSRMVLDDLLSGMAVKASLLALAIDELYLFPPAEYAVDARLKFRTSW